MVLGEPGGLELLVDHALGAPTRTGPGARAPRLGEAALDELAAGSAPTGCPRAVQAASATRPPGPARGASRAARPRGRPAACSPSGTARRRCSPPRGRCSFRVDLLEAHVADAELLGPALGGLEHLGGKSEQISVAARLDQLGGQEPVSPVPAASSSSVVARLRVDRVDHPGRDGHRRRAQLVAPRLPARGLRRPSACGSARGSRRGSATSARAR